MAIPATITRRLALLGAAASSAALAVPAVALAKKVDVATPIRSDWMDKAIEAHRRAYEAFDASCPYADEIDPRYSEGEAENNRLSDSETMALNALLTLVPNSVADIKKRSTYLLSRYERGDVMLDGEQISMLLASMA